MSETAIPFDNTWARELPGTFVACQPARVPAPRLLYANRELAAELGLDPATLDGERGAALFAGNRLPPGAEPIAQAYAGHQFGGFSPQLGDGRALLVGEVVDRHGRRRDIAFKGSGRTPFSRGGDGKAAVAPMLREVLVGEAMHALGIPTTRALAVAATGEPVYRDRELPGAVLTRVAASHLRVGSFQFFSARGDLERLRRLADYAIARHDPALAGRDDRVLAFVEAVARRQARLVARWMNVGFIHGVMNTDNMTISGETIDYGPCAFVEGYDPATVFSSIDRNGRYAFGNQPAIARWNIARLAEALLPLIAARDDDADVQRAVDDATRIVDAFPGWYADALLAGQRAKLGLAAANADDDADDRRLAEDWLDLLHQQQADFTRAWRRLADAAEGDEAALRAEFAAPAVLDGWLARWRERCVRDDAAADPAGRRDAATAARARAQRIRRASPWIIPRNHLVEEALDAAQDDGDLAPLTRMLQALRRPFDEHPDDARYAEPAPPSLTAAYRTFCGT